MACAQKSSATAVLQGLVWPAAAGNVAWAFFSVLNDVGFSAPGGPERLSVLLILSVYLGGSWLHSESNPLHRPFAVVLDGALAIAIVVFAIAAESQTETEPLRCALTAVLLIAVFGHLSGAFARESQGWGERGGMALVNVPGLVIMWFPPVFDALGSCGVPVALAVVVALWFIGRFAPGGWSGPGGHP